MNNIQNSYYTKILKKREYTYLKREQPTNIFEALLAKEKGIVRVSKIKCTHTQSVEAYTDTFELSPETETRMRDEYIGRTLESGEPLKGISLEDFKFYYIRKLGFSWSDEHTRQLYSQAQKGWKASCAQHEWRTDPNFVFTLPMFDSPELTEDREAAFEKFKNGGELTRLEKDLLSTFPDVNEGQRRINEVVQERGTAAFRQRLLDKMASSGVELTPDDEITFTVWGYDIIDVTGTVDDEKLNAIREAMKDEAHSLDLIGSGKVTHGMSKGTRFQFDQFKEAQHYLDLAGGGSLTELSKDGDGNYHGIPDELDKFLRENKHYHGNDMARLQAIWVEHAFDAAIAAVEEGRHDWFRSKVGTVTFKNGEFSA